MTRSEQKLYYYAIGRALSVLVGHAARLGRGWYHFADGEVIVATELAL
jgi:hypothetical protein